MLWTVNYYDEDGRVFKTFKQHYKGNTLVAGNYDEITNTYDFTGAVLSSTRSHKVNGMEALKILNEYDYDHMGRKTNTWQQINTDAKVLLVKNTYDDMGKLYKKSLHSVNGGSTFLENIKYKYNMAGWLVGAKAGALDMALRYNYPQHGAAEQYNGNISEVEYTAQGSGNKYFKYTYDDQNRLTYSDYSDPGKELNEEIAYDKAGNITSLKRGPSSNAAIIYNYTNGNQLASTSGSLTGSFTYDANGSALTDTRRMNTFITYNQLNLPSIVSKANGTSTASYIYDATGTKLRSVQNSIVRDYVSGIEYNPSGAIDFIATEEGRAVRNTDGTYRYEYYLKDNLGNVRVTIDNGPSGRRVVQEDEYYAFGKNKNRSTSGDKNNYLYNGKELQDVLTDEYDYGARFYDPVLGRWNVVDPKAELGRRWSPYAYAFDNPIYFVDPDGMWPDPPNSSDGDQIGLIRNATAEDKKHANLATSIIEGTFLIAESLGINALDNLIFSDQKITPSSAILTGVAVIQGMESIDGGMPSRKSGMKEPLAIKEELPVPTAGSSRAARRQVMRDVGIPTSQQPVYQSRNSSGREFGYEVFEPYGTTSSKSVQQQTMDRSHPDQPHWEAGKVKKDNGVTRTNNYGRPKLEISSKKKVDY